MKKSDKNSVIGEKRFPRYRGKNVHCNWVYGFYSNPYVPRIERAGSDEHGSYLEYIDVFTETVGRETFKTDMHGIDVFEDDVLKFDSYDENGKLESTEYLLVYWDYKIAGFLMKSSQSDLPVDMDCIENCEIIGNIHDNPEYLKLFEVAK